MSRKFFGNVSWERRENERFEFVVGEKLWGVV
jgi:hypothetical protein